MPPRKKEKMSKNEEELKPLELLAKSRTAIANELAKDAPKRTNLDIEQNLREIKGILATNKDIWDRCKSSLTKRVGTRSVECERYGYEKIETRKSSGLQFITIAEHSTRSFDVSALVDLPDSLNPNGIFQPPLLNDESGSFVVDFEKVFENAQMLHDDILTPYLGRLKDHLGAIQVYLGQIDEWLMVPHDNIDFIKNTFGNELGIPDSSDIHKHSTDGVCVNCKMSYHAHTRDAYASDPARKMRCQNGYRQTYFKGKTSTTHILKTVSGETGTYETTFDLSDERQRKRLKSFLDFIAI